MIFFKIVLTWSWIYGFLGFLYKDSFYSLKFNSYNSLDFWVSGFFSLHHHSRVTLAWIFGFLGFWVFPSDNTIAGFTLSWIFGFLGFSLNNYLFQGVHYPGFLGFWVFLVTSSLQGYTSLDFWVSGFFRLTTQLQCLLYLGFLGFWVFSINNTYSRVYTILDFWVSGFFL